MSYRVEPSPFIDYYGSALDGLETFPRFSASSAGSVTMSTGFTRFTYVTARQQVAVTKLVAVAGSTAAGATPSVCRFGLYTVASNGDLTLVARTANTTSIFATQNTEYPQALDTTGGYPSSYTLVPGQRYALAALVVTATTAPTVFGVATVAAMTARSPRVASSIGSQSDLGTSHAAGTLINSSGMMWMAAVAS